MGRLIRFMQTSSLMALSFCSYAQNNRPSNSKIDRLTTFSPNQTTEKLYLQFDKPYYATGDTIWFKAYLLNNFLLPSVKSGVLNIDIANDSDKVIKQYRLPVQSGLAWGNIALSDKDFKPGTYTLRAYTKWMRNFGDEGFFYKSFTITSTDNRQLLVSVAFGNTMANGPSSLEAKLRFSTMTDLPFAVQPLTLKVMNAGKQLYRQKYITGVDGALDINFTPPQKADHLTIVAENDKKERLAVIPVPVNRPENADIQFLPEGGNLVTGLPAHIGFKAISENGKGLEVSGVILDHTQKQVSTFKSQHLGMGSFDLDVKEGETYTARVTLPGDITKQYSLPPVKSTGTTLSIKNEMPGDSLGVKVSASKDTLTSGKVYFLIGRARGIVCYAAIINLREFGSISKKIAKSLFPTGIAHFTLMTANYQPVNERLVYIDHHDDLNIKFNTNKPNYDKRDSVGLSLKVLDTDGKPILGNFSMAVTDDAQVKPDSLNAETINTRFLLTGDLKGYIEQPGYYLSQKKPAAAWQALDNLLLTQGWVGYDWAQVLSPPKITYPPEHDFTVSGHVTNVLNKPVADTHIMLFSKSPAMVMDTVSSNYGQFVFDHLPRVDTPAFVLKAVNKSGKSFNVNVKVDEQAAPVFTAPALRQLMPWYVNIDSILITYNKRAALTHQQQDFNMSGHILNEVKVTAKKIVKGSQNLNGPGNADIVLDEKDLEAAGKKTWLQLFQEKITGFRESDVRRQINLWFFIQDVKYLRLDKGEYLQSDFKWYYINDKPVKFYVDGVSITDSYPAARSEILQYSGGFQNITNFLNSTSAEDIIGIEVSFTDKYSGTYMRTYTHSAYIHMDDVAFIEITTRSGHGPLIDNTPGMYLYKPMPFSYPKQFYKPKYTVKDTTSRQDLRSTIDWEPNVTTNANGEANIWFYTADEPSTYTVTIEGTDMNGHFGYAQGKIKVETFKDKTK